MQLLQLTPINLTISTFGGVYRHMHVSYCIREKGWLSEKGPHTPTADGTLNNTQGKVNATGSATLRVLWNWKNLEFAKNLHISRICNADSVDVLHLVCSACSSLNRTGFAWTWVIKENISNKYWYSEWRSRDVFMFSFWTVYDFYTLWHSCGSEGRARVQWEDGPRTTLHKRRTFIGTLIWRHGLRQAMSVSELTHLHEIGLWWKFAATTSDVGVSTGWPAGSKSLLTTTNSPKQVREQRTKMRLNMWPRNTCLKTILSLAKCPYFTLLSMFFNTLKILSLSASVIKPLSLFLCNGTLKLLQLRIKGHALTSSWTWEVEISSDELCRSQIRQI